MPMENITTKVEGGKLIITVDLSGNTGLSGSGKSMGIASTHGNARVEGHPEIMFGLNVFRPLPKDQRPR